MGAPLVGQPAGYAQEQLTQAQRDSWLNDIDVLTAKIGQANTILQQNAFNLTAILGVDYEAFHACRMDAEGGKPAASTGVTDTWDIIAANWGFRLQSTDPAKWTVTPIEYQAYNFLKQDIDCMLNLWAGHQAVPPPTPTPQPGPIATPKPESKGPSTEVLVGGGLALATVIGLIWALS